MSSIYTIEIESGDGEPIDIDEVIEALRDNGIKLSSYAPGWHSLAEGSVRRALEDLRSSERLLKLCVSRLKKSRGRKRVSTPNHTRLIALAEEWKDFDPDILDREGVAATAEQAARFCARELIKALEEK